MTDVSGHHFSHNRVAGFLTNIASIMLAASANPAMPGELLRAPEDGLRANA